MKGNILNLFAIVLCFCMTVGSVPIVAEHSGLNKDGKLPEPILFLHGWGRTWWDWKTLLGNFSVEGWPDDLFYYDDFEDGNNCSMQANINNAHAIKRWVDEILEERDVEKVDIIAHSMGGVSSRYYVKFLGGIDKIDDLVMLVGPHHADPDNQCGYDSWPRFTQLVNEGDETPGGLLNDTIGPRADPIFPDVIYNGTHIPGNINYTSLYIEGFDGAIRGNPTSLLDGAYNIQSASTSHLGILTNSTTYSEILPAIDGPFDFEQAEPISTIEATSSEPTLSNFVWFVPSTLVMVVLVKNRARL